MKNYVRRHHHHPQSTHPHPHHQFQIQSSRRSSQAPTSKPITSRPRLSCSYYHSHSCRSTIQKLEMKPRSMRRSRQEATYIIAVYLLSVVSSFRCSTTPFQHKRHPGLNYLPRASPEVQGALRTELYYTYDRRYERYDNPPSDVDWEVCQSLDGSSETLLVLPSDPTITPTSIFHFVGGTFFGSTPKIWYRKLLDSLVRRTQCAVVVTPIPVTILRNPLNHVQLASRLRKSFVESKIFLEEEYGDVIADVPVYGLGHSLGSRLLVVLATLLGEKHMKYPLYNGMILLSFTNFSASVGIPLVQSFLNENAKNVVDAQREKEQASDWFGETDDEYDDWGSIAKDLRRVLGEQGRKMKMSLTPNSEDLEFYPSPAQLWKAVEDDKMYPVKNTLVIQFDDDAYDSGSRLSAAINKLDSTSIRFARLRGSHLSPLNTFAGSRQKSPKHRCHTDSMVGTIATYVSSLGSQRAH